MSLTQLIFYTVLRCFITLFLKSGAVRIILCSIDLSTDLPLYLYHVTNKQKNTSVHLLNRCVDKVLDRYLSVGHM